MKTWAAWLAGLWLIIIIPGLYLSLIFLYATSSGITTDGNIALLIAGAIIFWIVVQAARILLPFLGIWRREPAVSPSRTMILLRTLFSSLTILAFAAVVIGYAIYAPDLQAYSCGGRAAAACGFIAFFFYATLLTSIFTLITTLALHILVKCSRILSDMPA